MYCASFNLQMLSQFDHGHKFLCLLNATAAVYLTLLDKI